MLFVSKLNNKVNSIAIFDSEDGQMGKLTESLWVLACYSQWSWLGEMDEQNGDFLVQILLYLTFSAAVTW